MWFGRVLKHTLNRVTSRIARTSHGPFALVRHVGRKSGKSYETPIIVQRVTDGFVIELTYGDQVDWYRNIVAANGCGILYHRVSYTITGLEPIPAEQGIGYFTAGQQRILRLLRREHFVKLLGGPAA